MSLMCGCVGLRDAPAKLDAMLAQLRYHPWYVDARSTSPTAAFGAFAFADDEVKLFRDQAGVAVIAGEIYDAAAQTAKLAARGIQASADNHAELCFKAYRAFGQDFFRDLNGKFSLAVWEADGERLTLIADRFGMRPLYFAGAGGGFVFGSAIKALLAAHVPRTADTGAIAQFFAFQQYAGAATAIAGVERLMPAAWVTYDARQKTLARGTYWNAKALLSPAGAPADALERIDAALFASVRRCSDGPDGLGLALSGGLDPRAILGLVAPDQPLTCVTLGLPGAMDLWVSERMAKVMGRAHYRSILGPGFFRSYDDTLRRMVHLTEGHIPTAGITMPSLELYRSLGIRALLRGHGGEFLHMTRAYKYSLAPEDRDISTLSALEMWMLHRIAAGRALNPSMEFLTPAYRGLVDPVVRATVAGWMREYADVQPILHSVWLLFVSHHLPRNVAASIVKFGSVLETRIPYLDADLLTALLAAPPEMKYGDRIQTHILERRAPELLAAPNTNTGVGMGARPEVVAFMHFMVRVLAKLGVPGFQPYERLGLWLRREFKAIVDQVLLSERCLDRGIFDRAGVHNIIAQHASRRRNHTVLIQAMLCFEVAMRELLDGENILEVPLLSPAARARAAPGLIYQPQS